MATKKQVFISVELDWAEEQLTSWKKYIDEHPIDQLKDRMSYKETKNGGVIPMVVSSIEQQGKFIQETMQKYLTLLAQVNDLREKEEAKLEARGGKTIEGGMMGRLTKSADNQ